MSTTPKRPIIHVKPRKPAAPAAKPTTKPQTPPTPKPPRKPKGPSYTAPRAPHPYMPAFWLVMKDSGRRPKVRHASLEDARTEAQRIAAACPGAHVWVIECRTVETHQAPSVKEGSQ